MFLVLPLLLTTFFPGLVRSFPSFTDPRWNDSWHLHPKGSPSMRIQEAWETGLTGKGVKVLILDVGIDRFHPDLYRNYDPRLSYDFIDDDMEPHIGNNGNSSHGTKMAGVIASEKNNSACGVGIAFDARFGVARILDKSSSKSSSNFTKSYDVLHLAISYKKQTADIIVAALGPRNEGIGLGSIPNEIKKALEESELGREGRGNIIMLSTGNSGGVGESCSFNAFSQSIHTISINAVGMDGEIPFYAESCSSVMASAFGSSFSGGIVTTTVGGGCVGNFTGTSSSNAVASGVMALVLEANPNLTWRDVQHLIVRSVVPKENLDPSVKWKRNAAGLYFSPTFGFGLIDALSITERAATWKNVPPQIICRVAINSRALVSGADKLTQTAMVEDDSCGIRFLEHVQVELTAYSLCRGNVNLELKSPSGTVSNLLSGRRYDFSSTAFNQWRLLSLEFWGEGSAIGEWDLSVFRSLCVRNSKIALESWTLILYGTATPPEEK